MVSALREKYSRSQSRTNAVECGLLKRSGKADGYTEKAAQKEAEKLERSSPRSRMEAVVIISRPGVRMLAEVCRKFWSLQRGPLQFWARWERLGGTLRERPAAVPL